MGTIHHDFVIAVAGYNHDKAEAAFAEVKAFAAEQSERDAPFSLSFDQLLIGPVESLVNFYTSYVMVPDGSKEYWSTSDIGNDIRNFFIEKMSAAGCSVAHGAFGELGSSFNVK